MEASTANARATLCNNTYEKAPVCQELKLNRAFLLEIVRFLKPRLGGADVQRRHRHSHGQIDFPRINVNASQRKSPKKA